MAWAGVAILHRHEIWGKMHACVEGYKYFKFWRVTWMTPFRYCRIFKRLLSRHARWICTSLLWGSSWRTNPEWQPCACVWYHQYTWYLIPFFLEGDPNSSRYDDLVQDDSNALAILDDYFTGVSWLIIGVNIYILSHRGTNWGWVCSTDITNRSDCCELTEKQQKLCSIWGPLGTGYSDKIRIQKSTKWFHPITIWFQLLVFPHVRLAKELVIYCVALRQRQRSANMQTGTFGVAYKRLGWPYQLSWFWCQLL